MKYEEAFLSLDYGLLLDLEPDLLKPNSFWNEILGRENHRQLQSLSLLALHLSVGIPGPAIVTGVNPLRIAAYGAKINKCVQLEFAQTPQCAQRIEVGARLLCVCDYNEFIADDLVGTAGPESWKNFSPIIAEFVSTKAYQIAVAIREIPEEQWTRCEELIPEFSARGIRPRNGLPTKCGMPATAGGAR